MPSEVTDMSQIVWESITNNFTPDMARLRYNGPINLFIYGKVDHYKDTEAFFHRLYNKKLVSRDWRIQTYDTATTYAYAMYKNPEPKPGEYDYMVSHIGENKSLTMARIRGRMIRVTLDTLMELDRYYFNEARATRKLTPLGCSKQKFAWMYVFPESFISRQENVEICDTGAQYMSMTNLFKDPKNQLVYRS